MHVAPYHQANGTAPACRLPATTRTWPHCRRQRLPVDLPAGLQLKLAVAHPPVLEAANAGGAAQADHLFKGVVRAARHRKKLVPGAAGDVYREGCMGGRGCAGCPHCQQCVPGPQEACTQGWTQLRQRGVMLMELHHRPGLAIRRVRARVPPAPGSAVPFPFPLLLTAGSQRGPRRWRACPKQTGCAPPPPRRPSPLPPPRPAPRAPGRRARSLQPRHKQAAALQGKHFARQKDAPRAAFRSVQVAVPVPCSRGNTRGSCSAGQVVAARGAAAQAHAGPSTWGDPTWPATPLQRCRKLDPTPQRARAHPHTRAARKVVRPDALPPHRLLHALQVGVHHAVDVCKQQLHLCR